MQSRAAQIIQRWFRRACGYEQTEPFAAAQFRRPSFVTVDDLAGCQKKSDLLRLLQCSLSADAHKLADGRAFCVGPMRRRDRWRNTVASRFARLGTDTGASCRCERIQRALNCCGCGPAACDRCGSGRVHRDAEKERQAWGSLESPAKTIKFHSYRTEADEDGNFKSDNDLHLHKVHPSVFLDELWTAIDSYKKHYHTLCRQKQAHLDQERNFTPNQLLLDQDFAENFTIILNIEIQSAHWISKQVTIFITISQHLDQGKWDSPDSALSANDEVTTEHGWARVTAAFPGGSGGVPVAFANGQQATIPRAKLHHRVVKSVAHLTVSNDKDHDTWMVQHAMARQAAWLKTAGAEIFPDLKDGDGRMRLTEHLVRSDGAGSHFKNKFTFHFLGSYREDEGLAAVVWDVGCPGHGKGPWDGIAGFIKRTLRARIIDGGLVLEDEHAVYEEVVKVCNELNEKNKQKEAKGTFDGKINHWNVMWVDTSDIPPRPAQGSVVIDRVHHRDRGIGIRDLFSFTVSYKQGGATGLFLQQFTCGCPACVASCRRDDAGVASCTAPQCNALCVMNKTENVGVAAAARARKEKALERASQLVVGDIVALETGDHRRLQSEGGGTQHAYLVARVVAQPGGAAYTIADDRAMRSNHNEEYRAGDALVSLRLFDRTERDETGRRFVVTDRLYVANALSLVGKVEVESLGGSGRASSRGGLASHLSIPESEDRRIEQELSHSESSTARRRR